MKLSRLVLPFKSESLDVDKHMHASSHERKENEEEGISEAFSEFLIIHHLGFST